MFDLLANNKLYYELCLNKVTYFIKWLNYEEKDNTWEPIENLNCKELVDKFEKEQEKNGKATKTKEKPARTDKKEKKTEKSKEKRSDTERTNESDDDVRDKSQSEEKMDETAEMVITIKIANG